MCGSRAATPALPPCPAPLPHRQTPTALVRAFVGARLGHILGFPRSRWFQRAVDQGGGLQALS